MKQYCDTPITNKDLIFIAIYLTELYSSEFEIRLYNSTKPIILFFCQSEYA